MTLYIWYFVGFKYATNWIQNVMWQLVMDKDEYSFRYQAFSYNQCVVPMQVTTKCITRYIETLDTINFSMHSTFQKHWIALRCQCSEP